jgi:pSer/pThr/pTyr-binding forkhead associated (FHA) protein
MSSPSKPAVASRADPVPTSSAGTHAPRNDDKIVGAPVVDIASSGQAPVRHVTCARCHGNCVTGTRFCKYCGAPLDEAPAHRSDRTAEPARAARLFSPPQPPPPIDDIEPPETRPTERRAQEAASRTEPVRRPHIAPYMEPARAMAPGPPGKPSASSTKPAAGHSHREDVLEAFPPIYELVEPGRRPEISQLAGSPIPAMPLSGGPSRSATRRGERRHSGRLVVIVEDGSEGRSFPLSEGQLDIGRVDGDIILEDDHYVSPRHARLRVLDGRWTLRDLDSTNHVYVRLRKQHPLKDADLLLLGLEVLQFQTVSDGERGLGHAMQHGTLLFGSPATPRRARLCQRTVEGVIRDMYHLFRDETVIGREVGDIVFTGDPFLSRRHAVIRRNPTTGEFSIIDLDSSNGTYFAIRGEIDLHNGDFLRIGQHLFRVDLG